MKHDLANFSKLVYTHIEQGERWRIAIIGIIFAGVVQIVSFSVIWGQIRAEVRIDNERICAIEQLHPRVK